jgi:mono/diheme cytochrome c family protein
MQQGDQLSGGILYQTYCAACHERNGQGDNNRFPPLVDSEWVTGDEDRLIDVVLNGMQGEIEVNGKTYNDMMPQNQHLEDLAIASILTYVRKRFGGVEGRPITTEQVSKVRTAAAAKN